MLLSALLSLYTFICPVLNGQIENRSSFLYDTPQGVAFLSDEPDVIAISDGIVVLIPENPIYKGILVREGNVWVSYRGMDSIRVAKGATICKGEKIGTAKPNESSQYRIVVEVWDKEIGSTTKIPEKELYFLCNQDN